MYNMGIAEDVITGEIKTVALLSGFPQDTDYFLNTIHGFLKDSTEEEVRIRFFIRDKKGIYILVSYKSLGHLKLESTHTFLLELYRRGIIPALFMPFFMLLNIKPVLVLKILNLIYMKQVKLYGLFIESTGAKCRLSLS